MPIQPQCHWKKLQIICFPTHAIGKAKAAFFQQIGFDRHQAKHLQQALKEIAQQGKVRTVIETPYGKKYIVDGTIHTPSGKSVPLRTVWIVEKGSQTPRFVTAYPQ